MTMNRRSGLAWIVATLAAGASLAGIVVTAWALRCLMTLDGK